MKNCIYKNGVYIYANGALHTPESYEGTTGKVVVVIGSVAFEVYPAEIKNATWDQAMSFAKGKGGNLPTRLQRMNMCNYHSSLQAAITKTGGSPLSEGGFEWLCEEYNSTNSWYYAGYLGYMSNGSKYGSLSGRPLLAFSFDQLKNY